MTNFRQAFKMGLDANERAARARKEISEVLDNFASEVEEESGGLIEIRRGIPGRQLLKRTAQLMSSLGSPPYDIPDIVALYGCLRSHDQTREELCEFELGDEGYPVILRYSREHVRCHDRQDFERALEEMLKHPSTGGRIKRLIQAATSMENRDESAGSLPQGGE